MIPPLWKLVQIGLCVCARDRLLFSLSLVIVPQCCDLTRKQPEIGAISVASGRILSFFSHPFSLSLSLFRFGRLTTSTTPGRPLITRAQSAVAAAAVKATHINRLSLSLPKSIKLYVSNYTLQRNSIQI